MSYTIGKQRCQPELWLQKPSKEKIDASQDVCETATIRPEHKIDVDTTDLSVKRTEFTEKGMNMSMDRGALTQQTRTYRTGDYTKSSSYNRRKK